MIPWRVDYSLNDGGPTVPDFSLILYNPDALNRMPDSVRLWGMGHECGHAHNHDPNELHADCWSITEGMEQNWFGSDGFDDLVKLFEDDKGDLHRPPGTVRIANMS